MPAIQANAKNFLLTTDYPLDKIIFLAEGSVTVPAGGSATATKAHGLPYIPLVMGNYSTVADFSVAYEFEGGPIAPPNGFSPILYDIDAYADPTNVIIECNNFISSSPVTIYYRVYCFSPSDQNVESPPTNQGADDFTFNTDHNYTKLVMADVFDHPGNASFTTTFTSVVHGLGYVPQVIYWVEEFGLIKRPMIVAPLTGGVQCNVTDNSITFGFTNTGASRIHYKVYLDEA